MVEHEHIYQKKNVEVAKTVVADNLRSELEQSYKIINALSASYHDVYYANLETGKMRSYRCSRVTRERFGKRFEDGDFEKNFYAYVRGAVHPDDQELFEPVLSRSSVRQLFERQDSYSFNYRAVRNNETHYCQCQIVKILGNPQEFVFAFRNIDREIVLENEKQTDIKRNIDMISSMVKLYDNAIYVNVPNDSFKSLQLLPRVGGLIDPGKKFEAQTTDVIKKLVHEDYQQRVISFMSLNKIDARMNTRNMASMEYLSIDNKWSELFMIVAKRDENNSIEEIFIATQNINEEKLKKIQQEDLVRTQNQQLRDALRLSHIANVASNDFFSHISHDIRTPLNDIQGLATLITDCLDDKEKAQLQLQKLQKASSQLLALVEDVLDISKIKAGKFALHISEFDLHYLIQNVIDLQKKDITLHKHNVAVKIAENTHLTVTSDKARFQQIFTNLLSNMIKYTPDGGNLQIGIKEVRDLGANTAEYEFSFTDDGIGMDAEIQKNIFAPFIRGEYPSNGLMYGSGLGLTIVKSLVENLDGHLSMTSMPGQGTTICINIILQQRGKADQGQLYVEEKPQVVLTTLEDLRQLENKYKSKRVLLVEDHDINAEIIMTILEATGLTVELANNGLQAVNKVRQHEEGYYDLIFMDIRMPIMNGYEATKVIRELTADYIKHLPIIALTANTFPEDVDQALQSGMDEHMAKPVQLDFIADALRRWIKV